MAYGGIEWYRYIVLAWRRSLRGFRYICAGLPTSCDCPFVNGFSFLLPMRLVTAVPEKFLRWNGSKGLARLILQRCTVCFAIFMLKEPSRAFAYLDAGSLCADSEIRPRAVHSGGMKTKLHRRLGNLACRRSLQRWQGIVFLDVGLLPWLHGGCRELLGCMLCNGQ